MSDIAITAANVVKSSNAVVKHGTAGESITQGQWIYKATTGKLMKADADAATELARTPIGVALNAASDGQPLSYQSAGEITIGGTLTAGVAYYLSNTAGGMCPVADVGTGEYVVLLGLAKSASVLDIAIKYTGVAN